MSGGGDNEVKETVYQKELSRIALEELGIYKEDVIPFRNSWLQDVTGDFTNDQNKIAGQVNAELSALGSAIPTGFDPSSGAVTSGISALAMGEAGAKATVSAKNSVKNQQISGLQAALDVMRGESADAQSTLSGVASASVSNAINKAYAKRDVSNTVGSSLSSAIGLGAAVYRNRKKPPEDDLADYNDTLLQKNYLDWS